MMIPNFLLGIIGCSNNNGIQPSTSDIEAVLSTPVLLLHGTDDAWVDVGLGRQAHRSLTKAGMQVDWHEFSGAENEGHWVKEPEGFDVIVLFLGAALQV